MHNRTDRRLRKMMKFATIVCVVFLASASNGLFLKNVKTRLIMTTAQQAANGMQDVRDSFIKSSEKSIESIEKTIKEQSEKLVKTIVEEMNEAAKKVKESVDDILNNADESKKMGCNTEKKKLDDSIEKTKGTLTKCIEDEANKIFDITNINKKAIAQLSEMPIKALQCSSDDGVNIVGMMFCLKNLKLDAQRIILRSTSEIASKNQQIILSFINMSTESNKCKESDVNYKDFLNLKITAVKTTEECIGKKA